MCFVGQVSYNAALDACGKGGRADKAIELLEQMELDGVPPGLITYNAAIYACAKVCSIIDPIKVIHPIDPRLECDSRT